jgi:hypothetical protein
MRGDQMRLFFNQVPTLPRLAWCARIEKDSDIVHIHHGPWVETAEHFWCEGAWSGTFLIADFDTSTLMGSGGRLCTDGDALMIATPSHTLERLFTLRTGKTLWISNSLAFILASADDSVNPRSLLYSVRLATIVNGINAYARFLPTRDHRTVRMHYHCNLLIDSRLRISETPKRGQSDFKTFADYRHSLTTEVRAIAENARHPYRKVKYLPIASVSAGYDSPMAAVLAKSVGCKEALTYGETAGQITPEDSGAEIAARLGMRAHIFDRVGYLKCSGCPEAEFLGWGAQESVWELHLERRILFTGFHGDKAWDRNCDKVTPFIVRGDPSGHNLSEFRLRVGWIHLPVPFLGVTAHPSIHRISNSAEMTPWSLGGPYDRPIPRRIVEEAGVDRQMFGMKKRAVPIPLDNHGPKAGMTHEGAASYMAYHQEHWDWRLRLQSSLLHALRGFYARQKVLNIRLGLRLGLHLPILIPREYRITKYGNLGILSLLPQWATQKLIAAYAKSLEAQASDGSGGRGRVTAMTETAPTTDRHTNGVLDPDAEQGLPLVR